MLKQIIAEPSVSSVSSQWDQSNARVIDLLQEWLDQLGFRTRKLSIPGKPGKFNLIATAGQGNDGLVLAGHTDTVPYNESRWTQNPLQLTEKDHRLYGLGATDMKGFFALLLDALRNLDLRRLRQPLIILATADEESSMSGARSLQEMHFSGARQAVIGEPTGLQPVRLHKGIAMECLRITGQSGHSSNPDLGNNALEGMAKVLQEILQWREELQHRYRNPLFAVPVTTINLGHIHGGDNPNRICGDCELHIDIRPLPGMNLQELREQLNRRLHRRLQHSGLQLKQSALFGGVEAFETPADARIVAAAETLCEHPAEAVAFATEGPFLNALGLDTIILGPGSINQAHQPDEFLHLDQIRPGIDIIRQLIQHFCL